MRYLNQILVVLLATLFMSSAFAATGVIAPFGSLDIDVPASQYINVFSAGPVFVYEQVGGPASHTAKKFVLETGGEFENAEVSFGPYTNATVIRIKAGAQSVRYSVGSGAVPIPCVENVPVVLSRTQLAPATETTTATLTGPELMGGLITASHTLGHTAPYTLPTGTLMDAASDLQNGGSFEWVLINTSAAAADTITVTAASGHTIVGIAVVQSAHASTGALYGASARFLTRKTAANTFVTYRLN